MTELRRELGVFSASLLVVGGIIGSGIFFTPAETARALPTAGWVLGVRTLGGVVALAGAPPRLDAPPDERKWRHRRRRDGICRLSRALRTERRRGRTAGCGGDHH